LKQALITVFFFRSQPSGRSFDPVPHTLNNRQFRRVGLPAPTMPLFRLRRSLLTKIRLILFSLDVFPLGFFSGASVALVVHRMAVIRPHLPLPVVAVVFLGPFLFAFDLLIVIWLHVGLRSPHRGWQIFSEVVCVAIMLCSASLVSLSYEDNAELSWARRGEVSLVLPNLIVRLPPTVENTASYWHRTEGHSTSL
jgi:hypothetical protein